MSGSGRSTVLRGRLSLWAGLIAAVLAAGGVLIAVGLTPGVRGQPPPDAIGGPFALVGRNGQKVTDRDFPGRWLLTYFGYTHCPDICPTTLADIGETLKLLGPLARQVHPLFITIDPERDTPDAVGSFLGAFDDRIIGLTGTPAQIAAVANEYHVYYAKSPPSPAEGESYAMDHTAFVYVIGPDGKYLTLFSPLQGQAPQDMAAKLRGFIAGAPSG